MNILVTGVNGLIGKRIVSYLQKNNRVIGVGRHLKYTGTEFIDYISADLSKECFIDKFKNLKYGIDVIIHCGAYIGYDLISLECIKTNCDGIYNIVKLAKMTNCKKIIYISSLPVIGSPIYLPIDENHPTMPKTLYHATKLFGENYFSLLKDIGIDTISLRITSPISEEMPQNKILPVLVKRCIEHKDIELYGTGKRVQNYIDVKDIVRAIEKAIEKDVCGVFNIASDKSYSNLELANICKRITKSTSKIIFNGIDDPEDKSVWDVSIEKAKKELGFYPTISIESLIIKIMNKQFKRERI